MRSKVEWTSTGERQYYTQAEYKAAHRMVPYEQRAVAVPYTADPTGVGAKPPTGPAYGKLRFRPHESAAGMDRAIVPTGLSYEEREREGTKMVPYSEPERRVVAAAPKQWETRRVDETAEPRATPPTCYEL